MAPSNLGVFEQRKGMRSSGAAVLRLARRGTKGSGAERWCGRHAGFPQGRAAAHGVLSLDRTHINGGVGFRSADMSAPARTGRPSMQSAHDAPCLARRIAATAVCFFLSLTKTFEGSSGRYAKTKDVGETIWEAA